MGSDQRQIYFHLLTSNPKYFPARAEIFLRQRRRVFEHQEEEEEQEDKLKRFHL